MVFKKTIYFMILLLLILSSLGVVISSYDNTKVDKEFLYNDKELDTYQKSDDLVFIHHSCGRNWLDDGLHSALLSNAYIDERNDIYYGSELTPDTDRPDSLSPTPGDKTDMNHWIFWFNDYLDGVKTHENTDGFNRIIMFKSCYPNSNIVSNGTEPGYPFSSTKTLTNYKAVYRHPNGSRNSYTHANGYEYQPLEDIFADNQDTLFIPVTAPPRHYAPSDATNNAEAKRSRVFNNWLKEDWLSNYESDNPDADNVAVFDWFDLLSYSNSHPNHPNRLKAEYGGDSGNSHPNQAANEASTQRFATGPNNFIDTAWNEFNLTCDVVIESTLPTDNADNFITNSGKFVFEFSEEMAGEATPETNLPILSWQWSNNRRWLNGSYDELNLSKTYYVNLEHRDFQSNEGIALSGDMNKTFKTISKNSTGIIEGRIVEVNGEPISEAEVSLIGTDIKTKTNEEGYYLIEDVPTGDQTIKISHPDCKSKKILVNLDEGETKNTGVEQLSLLDEEDDDNDSLIVIAVILLVIIVSITLILIYNKKR